MTNKNIAAKRVNLVSIKMVREKSALYEGRKVSTPEDAIRLAKSFIKDIENIDREVFIGIYLNAKNEPNALQRISVGSISSTIVHPREVIKSAILSNAKSMIFLHNHPSGDPTASVADLEITERLVSSADIMGIKVLDHIIINNNKFYSLKSEGQI